MLPSRLRDARIGEIEDRADAGVAGPFDDDEILLPGGAVERVLDAPDEQLVVRFLDVAPGEIRLDRDRAHRLQRRVDAEGLVDQDGVFVDLLAIDLHEALADRLDEADAPYAFAQRGEKAERGGGLAVVLIRRGDEDARRDVIHEAETWTDRHAGARISDAAAQARSSASAG